MSLRFKSQIVKLGIGVFHLFRYLWKSVSFIIIYGLLRPLGWIGLSLLKTALVPGYRLYLSLRQRLPVSSAARHGWLSAFTGRSLVHVVLIVLIFIIAANNVFARESTVEDFGNKTLLSKLLSSEEIDEEYIERANTAPRASLPSATQEGVIDRYHRNNQDAETERSLLAIARQESSGEVLAKSAMPLTSIAGQPRERVVEYSVEGGDTLSSIASHFGVSTNTLRWANGLDELALIKPGQVLKIPPVSGVVYTVAAGDTIDKIAKKYQADASAILEFNRLADASAIEAGAQLVIPGGKIDPPKPIAPVYRRTDRIGIYDSGSRPPNAKVSGSGLAWPAPGHRINQGYSYRHGGIDIDTNRSPIYAAEGGRVVRTNWGRGYGNNIIIDHGNGLQTLYAHLSKSYVGVGDSIGKGQTIGISGCTGWCTGDHLHFEVWSGGRRTNPFNYF